MVSGWQSTSSLVTRSEAASTLSSKLESAGLSRESANTRSTSAWRIHCWVQLLQSGISIQDSTNQRRVFTWERSEECSDSRILWSTHGSRCSSSVCSLSTNHSSVFR